MYQFDFLRTKKASNIISKVKKYDYVSFDIFDTLLKRKVSHPSDVFALVGERYKNTEFKNKRIMAEKVARKHVSGEEVTLEDIYKELGDEYEDYKRYELQTEIELLSANPPLYEVYQYCREQGKHIIITSDMYLPESFLNKILHKNGIEYERCFVSSEYGVQKITGNLFRKELEVLHISPSEIIHIGDSIRADAIGAWRAGIKFVLIPKASRISAMRSV